RAWIESGKLQRQEKWLYPPDAIREALANALAHRDYASPSRVQVRIFDDRLEIWNPGLLPPSLTVEKLKGTHDSIPRNPLIAKAFFWIKFAEEVGSGTSKIIEWCRQWGLPEPTYGEAGGSFTIVFYNPAPGEVLSKDLAQGGQKGWSEKVVRKGGQKLTTKQVELMGLLQQFPEISRKEISAKLDINESAVQRRLDALRKKGLVRRVGPDKGGCWEVHEVSVLSK
ncbi:MAG: winged helix-turn-helix transcriptional regulator, partial [Candidatus Omnitrophica bacterium]|nr:winged helix-turn-helix transcriptional regulator [Candidatus Omnitrophota bacterium]